MADAVLYGQTGNGIKQICPSFTGDMTLVQKTPDKGYAILTSSGTFSWLEGKNTDQFKYPYKRPTSIDVFVLGGGGGASGTAGATQGVYVDGVSVVHIVKVAHGAGGGSGSYVVQTGITPQKSTSVIIGAGGAAGTNGRIDYNGFSWDLKTTPTEGADGGHSSFGTITADGGDGGGVSASFSTGGTIANPPLTPLPAKGGNGGSGGGSGAWILAGSYYGQKVENNPNKNAIGGNGGTNGSNGTLATPQNQSGDIGVGSGENSSFLGKLWGNGGNGGGAVAGTTVETEYGDGGSGALLGTTRIYSTSTNYNDYYDWNKISTPSAGKSGCVIVRWGKWTDEEVIS